MSTLFDDFEKTSPVAWKQKIQVDLKGDDYNETLLWKSEDGIVIKPFYTEEDRTYQNILLPKNGFSICQSIFVGDEKIANALAKSAIKKGATAIQFVANKKFDFKILLQKIDIKRVTFYFKFNFLSYPFTQSLSAYVNSKKTYYQLDIFGNLAKSGNWYVNEKLDTAEFKKITELDINAIGIDAALYQNAGANRVQQLAYAIAQTNEYVETFGKDCISKLHFQFAVGSNYFLEIGKLRAFRLLLDSLVTKHGVKNFTAHIFCVPTKRNKTIYDYNVNMLRTTSECMSAILGGSDTISNLSYDTVFNKSNEFGERISRNQLLVLQQESYLAECQEIANGSYFIESITNQLAEKALEVFKQIEKSGGYLQQLKSGSIQSKINESAKKEEIAFLNKDLVLLGTNKLINKNDVMKDTVQLYPFVKSNKTKTLLPPIIEKRLAENIEQERLNNEK